MVNHMNTCLMEQLPLFNRDYDPYKLLQQLAKNQEGIAEQTAHSAWMIEQLTEQFTTMAQAMNIMHDRIIKLENQNEKD